MKVEDIFSNKLNFFMAISAIFLTEYFKIITDEGRKNKRLIWKIIKYSLISLIIIIFFITFEYFGYNTHLYQEFNTEYLSEFIPYFFVNLVFFLVLDTIFVAFDFLFNQIKIFCKYLKYSSARSIMRVLIIALISYIFNGIINSSPQTSYNILKQDVIVINSKSNKFKARTNTTFDFVYEEEEKKEADESIDNNLVFTKEDSEYLLKKGTKIKILKNTNLYPDDNPIKSYRSPDGNNKFVNISATNETKVVLKDDEEFTLADDVYVQLSVKDELRVYIEVVIRFLLSLLLLYYSVKYLIERGLQFMIPKVLGLAEEKKLSDIIKIYDKKDINSNKKYDEYCFNKDCILVESFKNSLGNNYCELDDIIIDVANHKATIISEKHTDCRDLASDYLLVKYDNSQITTEYVYFIIMNYLKNEREKTINIYNDLRKMKIKIPSKFFQNLIGKAFAIHLEEECKLFEYYKINKSDS